MRLHPWSMICILADLALALVDRGLGRDGTSR